MRKGFQISDKDLIEKMYVSPQQDKLETQILDENPQFPIKIYDAYCYRLGHEDSECR